jgi:UDP-glucose 4-epimerase
MSDNHRILITGANGYVGRLLFESLTECFEVVRGIDIRCYGASDSMTKLDVRDPELVTFLKQHDITHAVHLASIVQPGKDPDWEYDIDVNGTKNVLEACVAAAVRHLTVTSSGAAYGYHADNPEWLTEEHPLRGNDEFSYSRHKRLVEQMLAKYRSTSPQLEQLIMLSGDGLGDHTGQHDHSPVHWTLYPGAAGNSLTVRVHLGPGSN